LCISRLLTQYHCHPSNADGTDFKYLLELRAEAEFYGLTGLVTLIDRWASDVPFLAT
jgi:hypothetical protein